MKARLEDEKQLRGGIIFFDELDFKPFNAVTGKVDRFKLKQIAQAKGNQNVACEQL